MSLETEGDIFGMNPPSAAPPEHGEGETPSVPAATEVPAETAAPAADTGAEAPAPSTSADEAAPAAGAGGEQEPTLYAGRYGSIEELESGYLNLHQFATKEAQQRAILEDQLSRALSSGGSGLGQAGPQPGGYPPVPQIAAREGYPYGSVGIVATAAAAPQVELVPVPDMDTDPQGWQRATMENANRTATAAAAAQVQSAQQQWQEQQAAVEQQRQQQEYLGAINTALGQWRSEHSISPGEPKEQRVAEVVSGYQLPMHDKGALDFALEMTQNPQLAKAAQSITQASGLTWGQTAEGRAYVRQMAGIAAPGSPPATPNGQQAHLEHGGSGAPVPGAPGPAARPNDGWEAAKAIAEKRMNDAMAI